MNRRALLSGVALPLLLPVGGCIGDGPRSDSTETPPTTDEDADDETNSSTGDEGEGSGKTPSISDRFDCSSAHRPETDVQAGIEHEVEVSDETVVYESVGSVDYPTAPAAFDDDAVRTFVAEHERAYQRHEYLDWYGDRLVEFDGRIEEVERLDVRDRIATVRVDFSVHSVAIDDGNVIQTEPGGEAAAYAVDETGLVRTETEYRDHIEGSVREHTSDPLEEGTLRHCF